MNILNYVPATMPSKRSRAGFLFVLAMIGAAGILLPVKATAVSALQSGHVYKVGEEGVTAPHVVTKVEPQYTKAAHDAKIQGPVLLSLVIDENGMPNDVTVLRGLDDGLDQNAVDAINQWRFEAGKKDGKPVPVRANIEVQFRLK